MEMEKKPQIGTVAFKDGNYFLEVEGKQNVIPVGPHIDKAQLKELVGQKVDILYSEPKSFVIGIVGKTERRPRILCYVPADFSIFGVIEEKARAGLAKQLFEEKYLDKVNYEKLG